MPSLFDKTACEGLLPIVSGAVQLSEAEPARITSIAPFKGKERATGAALKALGLGWPAPGKVIAKGKAKCLWTGRGQGFLIGAGAQGLEGVAALTDQSDGWARMRLKGPGVEAVLSRLVPLDLSLAAFPEATVARTGLNHMMTVLSRVGAEEFEIMVFRSMAASAVHEVGQAMAAVAARAAVL